MLFVAATLCKKYRCGPFPVRVGVVGIVLTVVAQLTVSLLPGRTAHTVNTTLHCQEH